MSFYIYIFYIFFEPIISAVRHPYSKYIKYVMILNYFYCDISGAGTSNPLLSGYPFWYYNNPPSCQATPSGTITVLPVVRLPLQVLQQSSLLSVYPFWYYNSPPSCQATTPSGTTTVLPVVRLPLLVLQQSSLLSGYPFWYYNSPPCCQATLLVLEQSSLLSGYPFWYYNSPPSCQSTPSAMALQEGDKFFLIMKKRGGFS